MIHSSHLAPITLGLSIALFSTVSMADTGVAGNASISNVHYSLIDLTPNDDQMSALTLIATDGSSTSQIQNGFDSKSFPQTDTKANTSLDSLFTSVASPQSQAFSGSGGGLFSSIATKGYQQGDGYFQAFQHVNHRFLLSANSAIVITGSISGAASSSDVNNPNNFSTSLAAIELNQVTPADPTGQLDQFLYRDWTGPFGNPPSNETFSLTFTNQNAYTIEFNYLARVGSNGVVIAAAPVPEPETYAMLLSGLGMLAFLARRKARQNAL